MIFIDNYFTRVPARSWIRTTTWARIVLRPHGRLRSRIRRADQVNESGIIDGRLGETAPINRQRNIVAIAREIISDQFDGIAQSRVHIFLRRDIWRAIGTKDRRIRFARPITDGIDDAPLRKNFAESRERLFVIALDDKPRFCGIARTNDEARVLADNRNACKTALKEFPMP